MAGISVSVHAGPCFFGGRQEIACLFYTSDAVAEIIVEFPIKYGKILLAGNGLCCVLLPERAPERQLSGRQKL